MLHFLYSHFVKFLGFKQKTQLIHSRLTQEDKGVENNKCICSQFEIEIETATILIIHDIGGNTLISILVNFV